MQSTAKELSVSKMVLNLNPTIEELVLRELRKKFFECCQLNYHYWSCELPQLSYNYELSPPCVISRILFQKWLSP